MAASREEVEQFLSDVNQGGIYKFHPEYMQHKIYGKKIYYKNLTIENGELIARIVLARKET